MLSKIRSPKDIKNLNQKELRQLAQEIRRTIIEVVGKNGGHLASNLGVVELTIALHRVFNSPEDAIIWDVSHQCYAHKLLTGRYEEFKTLRQKNGLSGFTNKSESVHDYFNNGHSSTSISSALGLLAARELNEDKGKVIAVIGDGALTGGMAFEALSHAGQLSKNLIVILNDNQMSIDHNTGSVSRYLSRLTMTARYQTFRYRVDKVIDKIPYLGPHLEKVIFRLKRSLKGLFLTNNLFVDLGFEYVGPLDGHNELSLEKVLKKVSRLHRPVVVHVVTKKGKGYSPAEDNPELFHGIGPFQISDGTVEKFDTLSFTEAFSNIICDYAKENKDIVAITAAMAKGTGLSHFSRLYPDRFFDVGIAEEHAVTFAAGMAKAGLKPVFAVYSSFLQRAYDQVLHDVCAQNLPVVFAVDRAGLVGKDGATHQGIFDLSYLSSIPNLTVMAPKNKWELSDMLKYAIAAEEPVAIRYPRGEACDLWKDQRAPIQKGCAEVLAEGTEVALFAVGSMVETAWQVRKKLAEKGIPTTVVNARFAMPLDKNCLRKLAESHPLLVTMEENVASGGFGEHVAAFLEEEALHTKVLRIAIPDCFVEHGSVGELKKALGLDADSVTEKILAELPEEL